MAFVFIPASMALLSTLEMLTILKCFLVRLHKQAHAAYSYILVPGIQNTLRCSLVERTLKPSSISRGYTEWHMQASRPGQVHCTAPIRGIHR